MKAFHVVGGGSWGGGSEVVVALTESMAARGDDVCVVALDPETDRRVRMAGGRTVYCPFWFRAINPLDVLVLAWIWWVCRREKFDLVATHTSKGGFLGRIAARLAGVKAIVHHVHGFAFHEASARRTVAFYGALERTAGKFGDLMITVSEQNRQTAIEMGLMPASQVQTVLNGIDLEKFSGHNRLQARHSIGAAPEEKIILSTGRLCPQKGFEYAIGAMPMVVERFPEARLLIAGDGALREPLEQQVRQLGMEKYVRFLGFRRDIGDLLAGCDVFLMSSLWEGLSISLMEAMAARKAIVATDIWGNREMIDDGKNGLLVAPYDSPAVAAGLCRVLEAPVLAQRFADTAYRDACARFQRSRMMDETLAAYDRVAGVDLLAPDRSRTGRTVFSPKEVVD